MAFEHIIVVSNIVVSHPDRCDGRFQPRPAKLGVAAHIAHFRGQLAGLERFREIPDMRRAAMGK